MKSLRQELRLRIVPGRAESSAWFFKTGPGEYGEGDRFLGITVPEIRAVAKLDDGCSDISGLLHSKWHEERLLALLILVRRFERGDETTQREIYGFYLSKTRWINNWNLMHKACGWMLREAGKRDVRALEEFLKNMALPCHGRCSATRSRNFQRSAANSSLPADERRLLNRFLRQSNRFCTYARSDPTGFCAPRRRAAPGPVFPLRHDVPFAAHRRKTSPTFRPPSRFRIRKKLALATPGGT